MKKMNTVGQIKLIVPFLLKKKSLCYTPVNKVAYR